MLCFNCIWAFCLCLALAHPDLILLYILEWFTIIVVGNIQTVSMTLSKIWSCGAEMNGIWAFCLWLVLAHPGLILFYISESFTVIVVGNIQSVSMTLSKICSCGVELKFYWSLLFKVGACSPWFYFVIYLGMIHHHCCWKRTVCKYDTVKILWLWCGVRIFSEPFVYGLH